MPRSTRKRRSAEPETVGVQNVTATATATDTEDTVRELPFAVEISDAPEGYRPDRSPAGRKRIPSPFEDVLPGLKGKGWKNQPHDGKVEAFDYAADGTPKFNTGSSVKESNARVILRELQKAVKFLNSEEGGDLNLGLDVNVTATDVQFNVRDKQNRKPRSAPGGGDVSDGESESYGDSDTDPSGNE